MKSKSLNIITLIVLAVTTTAGCKKENDKPAECRIARLTRTDWQVTYDFTYGSDGKLISMLTLPDNDISSFEYNGNVTTVTVTHNGNFQHRFIITNNAYGLATNILLEQDQPGTDWFNQAITYEGRQVIVNKFSDSAGDSAIGNYIWEGGNPATYIVDGDIFHYDYYEDKSFQTGDWRSIQQMIAGYKIYEYKNLVKSSEINGNKTYYTYLFDQSGRITEATASSTNTTTPITIKLEYDCD